VRDFGDGIAGKSTISLLYQISHRIHAHLKYVTQKGEFGAKYAVLNKQGDCTEFAALFVALCRQKGIPARLVAGFKRDLSNRGQWIRHAWSEFQHNNLWIPCDIVEGFVIGSLPDLLPLFRGNWIGQQLIQEVKLVRKAPLPTEALSNASMQIRFDVFPWDSPEVPLRQIQEASSYVIGRVEILSLHRENVKTVPCAFSIAVLVRAPPGPYSLVISVQDKSTDRTVVLHPRIVLIVEKIVIQHEKYRGSFTLSLPPTPDPHSTIHVQICTEHGQLIAEADSLTDS